VACSAWCRPGIDVDETVHAERLRDLADVEGVVRNQPVMTD
jgi:hypothetical protein